MGAFQHPTACGCRAAPAQDRCGISAAPGDPPAVRPHCPWNPRSTIGRAGTFPAPHEARARGASKIPARPGRRPVGRPGCHADPWRCAAARRGPPY